MAAAGGDMECVVREWQQTCIHWIHSRTLKIQRNNSCHFMHSSLNNHKATDEKHHVQCIQCNLSIKEALRNRETSLDVYITISEMRTSLQSGHYPQS